MGRILEQYTGSDLEAEHLIDVTLPIALNVIEIAGFRRTMNWQADTVVSPGHKMSFHDALRLVSTRIILKDHHSRVGHRADTEMVEGDSRI